MKILSIGDNCIDDYVELGVKFPGGNALNLAVYASQTPNIQAEYIGVLGTDENGVYMYNQIEKQGLPTKRLITKKGENAVTKILIRNGDRVFHEYTEGVQKNETLPREKIPAGYDLIHFTIWGFGREHTPKLTNTLLSCDFSSQLDDPRTKIMRHLDYSFFSGSHLKTGGITPKEKIMELKERTQGMVVMTLGEHGSLVYDGEKIYEGKALPVNVVDTLGAGDAYIASFLVSRLKGKTIEESITAGHEAAREVCTRLGAWGFQVNP